MDDLREHLMSVLIGEKNFDVQPVRVEDRLYIDNNLLDQLAFKLHRADPVFFVDTNLVLAP